MLKKLEKVLSPDEYEVLRLCKFNYLNVYITIIKVFLSQYTKSRFYYKYSNQRSTRHN